MRWICYCDLLIFPSTFRSKTEIQIWNVTTQVNWMGNIYKKNENDSVIRSNWARTIKSSTILYIYKYMYRDVLLKFWFPIWTIYRHVFYGTFPSCIFLLFDFKISIYSLRALSLNFFFCLPINLQFISSIHFEMFEQSF